VFTRALHWSLSWARSIQSTPFHPISLRPILIYPPTYVLFFLVVSFLLASPPISYMHSSSPHSCYMPCPSHPPWLNHSNYIWRRVDVSRIKFNENRFIGSWVPGGRSDFNMRSVGLWTCVQTNEA
jgi:hypothetical protein